MNFSMKELFELQADKLIRIKQHPTEDLFVCNYTENTQLGRLWDRHPALVHCRGLVVNSSGTVVAKPFKKFGNVGEFVNITELSTYGEPEITEKLDGSMVVMVHLPNGQVQFTTRSTFESEQAIAATKLWYEKYVPQMTNTLMTDEFTYIFEYTAPENRVVVRYSEPTLTLIGVVDTVTGEELPYINVVSEATICNIPYVKREKIDDWKILQAAKRDNFEGWVLFWPENGVRVKIKLEEYMALHRIRSNMTPKFVWQAMKNGHRLDEMKTILEAEDKEWFENIYGGFLAQITAIEDTIYEAIALLGEQNLANIADKNTRKRAVRWLQDNGYTQYLGTIFAVMEGKAHEERIWKMIEP